MVLFNRFSGELILSNALAKIDLYAPFSCYAYVYYYYCFGYSSDQTTE